ncbi:MAG: hypothetical protein HQK91_14300 [Nitrospirae bacterium]|nr:hypothetical protein [Nitrospirota bacterium]
MFTITILGFLIAGFTVFATITKIELFKTMARYEHKESGQSFLKFYFFTFMQIFIDYILFIFFCLLIKLFASSGGLLTMFIIKTFSNFATIKHVLVSLGLVIIGTWFFYLLLMLKVFIFNVYIMIMTTIRWEFVNNKKNS